VTTGLPLLLPDVGGCTNPAEGLTRPVSSDPCGGPISAGGMATQEPDDPSGGQRRHPGGRASP
jgi:hypothetical protein